MTQQSQELRAQTLDQVLKSAPAGAGRARVEALIRTWLESLEEEDLAGLTADTIASPLWEGFSRLMKWKPEEGCRIEALSCADDRGGKASALLILNADMPFLVDSMVMALRRMLVPSRAVLNAVLSVERDSDGGIVRAEKFANGGTRRESYVLILLTEQLADADKTALMSNIRMAAADAAAVHRDADALKKKMAEVGAAAGAHDANGQEVAAFLDWARNGGFELFGFARYEVQAGQRELAREPGSALGVLVDRSHPVYGNCLAGIPGDFDTLAGRKETLSVVKADTLSTLHRDQQLDFIGVRDTDAQGTIRGEYCFVGLFSRAATSTTLQQMPFARGKVKQTLSIAGVRSEGFRAEKFLEILESLPRTEVLEAEPSWLANVCGSVVALYKQPRAKVFARRDVYGRHLNVLVYVPRERFGTHSTDKLAKTLREVSGASDVRVQTLLSDGPLGRVYLIANGANMALDLDAEIQQSLLGVLEGWHNVYDNLVDSTEDAELRQSLRKLRANAGRLPRSICLMSTLITSIKGRNASTAALSPATSSRANL